MSSEASEGSRASQIRSLKRLNITLTEPVFDQLRQIANERGMSISDVIRHAFALVQVAASAEKDSSRLFLSDSQGTSLREVIMPELFGSHAHRRDSTSKRSVESDRTDIVLPSSEEAFQQLNLGIFSEEKATSGRIQIVSTLSLNVIKRILASPDELFRITPSQFEEVVQDRLQKMGMETERLGSIYQPDGGVDIIFWPRKRDAVPFLGAVQVKHHRSSSVKTGVSVVREMDGILQRHKEFNIGMVVTNTAFTSNAEWFVEPLRFFLRLRDGDDIYRWLEGDFSQEWQEFPSFIDLGSKSKIYLR